MAFACTVLFLLYVCLGGTDGMYVCELYILYITMGMGDVQRYGYIGSDTSQKSLVLDRIVRCVRVFGAALYTACWYDDVQCYPYICMFSGLYACPCCFLLMCMKCERVGDDDDDDDPVYVAA